jgi:hypothetical protein
MTILLQSSDNYNDLARYNPETGEIVNLSRLSAPSTNLVPIVGPFSIVQGSLLMLYRHLGELHLRIDDDDFEIRDENQTVLTNIQDNVYEFVLLKDDTELYKWRYVLPAIDPPLSLDPTPFVEEEHFNFCLFVHNILTDPERRKRIYNL